MTYSVEFHAPSTLPKAFPAYQALITSLCKSIGVERVQSRLEQISLDWAKESGYYFKVIGDRHIFIHVSLNPRDFT